MCGIAGFAGGFVEGLGHRMNRLQKHRGPDGSGVYEDSSAGIMLAHVRLAILDLSDAAAQPMRSECGRWVISYNGEIYNYRELKRELEAKGERFRSTGDTEVLLRGLCLHGMDFIKRLDGIFAFALWDKKDRTLRLVRDPAGVKPLYYTEPVPGTILFASEIKALFALPGTNRSPDFETILQHMTFCHATTDSTAFKGIFRLQPGSTLVWHLDERRTETSAYWRPQFRDDGFTGSGYGKARDSLAGQLRDSCIRQTISDVPLGVYLSGGLDSSLVVHFAAESDCRDLHGYTAVYPRSDTAVDGYGDDGLYAAEMAKKENVPQTEITLAPELVSLLPRIVYHMDEPLADPAAIPAMLIADGARRKGTRVLLSGQGADELFGGYPRYWASFAGGLINVLPGRVWTGAAVLAGRIAEKAGETGSGRLMRRLKRGLEAAGMPPDERFLAYSASTREGDAMGIIRPEVRETIAGYSPVSDSLQKMTASKHKPVNRFLERDLTVYLPNHNLLYTDKMGMASGVEVRVPFLGQSLLDMVVPWPVSWKTSGMRTKVILRDAARGCVSGRIINRPKAGFGAPYRKWLRHDLQEFWNDLFSESSVNRRGWFDPAALRKARMSSQHGEKDLYMLQWAVITVELWARTFLDADPARETGITQSEQPA